MGPVDGILRRFRSPGGIIVLVLGVLAIAADIYFDTHYTRIEELNLSSSKLAPGSALRILQISDVHGLVVRDNNDLVDLARGARADLVALTGDLIDHRTSQFEPMWNLVDRLRRICPAVYYVNGNHEVWHPRGEAFVAGLNERGVTVLNNRRTVFRKGTVSVNVCGVNDAYSGYDDVARATTGVDAARFTLLLSHSPAAAPRLAGTPVDLMLSGHTHGGQVRVPFIGGLIAPGEGFFPKYDKGLYRLAEDQHVYVDSGVGTSVLPIRMFNRSQISLLVVSGHP